MHTPAVYRVISQVPRPPRFPDPLGTFKSVGKPAYLAMHLLLVIMLFVQNFARIENWKQRRHQEILFIAKFNSARNKQTSHGRWTRIRRRPHEPNKYIKFINSPSRNSTNGEVYLLYGWIPQTYFWHHLCVFGHRTICSAAAVWESESVTDELTNWVGACYLAYKRTSETYFWPQQPKLLIQYVAACRISAAIVGFRQLFGISEGGHQQNGRWNSFRNTNGKKIFRFARSGWGRSSTLCRDLVSRWNPCNWSSVSTD